MDNEGSFGEWNKLELLGAGGNGEVWKAERNGVTCALKILRAKRADDESYRRFVDEVRILRELGHDPGVLPILDAYLPEYPSKKDKAWLSMPLATSIKTALGERPRIEDVVQAIATVSETLARLAEGGICHRDIKPENLYQHDNGWVIGDFGLADFPDKDDVTEEGRALGPRFYIAPEMIREPMQASGFPADVWSLAKTMWVLATGQNFPPPHPQPANDPKDALAALIQHSRVYPLDKLIERATSKEPEDRPTALEFASDLKCWLAAANEPSPATDVAGIVSRIRLLSRPLFDTQSQMERCRKEAEMITQQLLSGLQSLSASLQETGLPYNEPQPNGGNFLKGSGLTPSNQGANGATVSMYTPPPAQHIYECGIMVQVLDHQTRRLYAAHRIRHHNADIETIWSDTHEVIAGSSREQLVLNELMQGLNSNLALGLERFAAVIS